MYVEGNDDRPIVERLIQWCRNTHRELPTTAVVRHKDGRFGATTLQGIARVAAEAPLATRVVGIRDLDWFYDECAELPDGPPNDQPITKEGAGYVLLTLPCKELENLLCDPELLFHALKQEVPREWLQKVIEEESRSQELITRVSET